MNKFQIMQIYAKKDYKSIQFLPFLVEKLSQEVESIPEPRRGVANEAIRPSRLRPRIESESCSE